jgi:hypothetical protein
MAILHLLLSGFLGLTSIVGIIPLLGVYLQWWITKNYILPLATVHGVSSSWVIEFSMCAASIFTTMTTSAWWFRVGHYRRQRNATSIDSLTPVLPEIIAKGRIVRSSISSELWSNVFFTLCGLLLTGYIFHSLTAYIMIGIFVVFSFSSMLFERRRRNA